MGVTSEGVGVPVSGDRTVPGGDTSLPADGVVGAVGVIGTIGVVGTGTELIRAN